MSIRSNHSPETLDQPDRPEPPVCWYVQYWLANIRSGRFLGGPYRTREAAVEYANTLLANDSYEHAVERVSVVMMKGGAR